MRDPGSNSRRTVEAVATSATRVSTANTLLPRLLVRTKSETCPVQVVPAATGGGGQIELLVSRPKKGVGLTEGRYRPLLLESFVQGRRRATRVSR